MGVWQTAVPPLLEGNKKGDFFFPELTDVQEQPSVSAKVRSQQSYDLQITFSLEALHRQQADLPGSGFAAACTLRQGLALACGHT